MEGGIPMLNSLLQQTLRSLCTSDSSASSKWVYAVFWRILPRNYPPPKWDHGASLLDRAKGNKRNWILVWEDGFCDFCECEYVKARFGADIFFKMSHEVYNFGEGLVGKIAADKSHKWVFRDSPAETDPAFTSSWNASIDPQPRAWEAHFNSGIETIAVISVREGAIQLGSFDKAVEDYNLVLNIQRKFSYLQSIPGLYTMQRPYLPAQNSDLAGGNSQSPVAASGASCRLDDSHQSVGSKRLKESQKDDPPTKSMFLGHNSPQNGLNGPLPIWSIPPLLPTVASNIGALLSRSAYASQSYEHGSMMLTSNSKIGTRDECVVGFDDIRMDNSVKMEASCMQYGNQEAKSGQIEFEFRSENARN